MLEIAARISPRSRYAARNAYHGGVVWDRTNHHRSSAHLGVIAYCDVAQDLGAGSDHHVVADARMTLSLFLARSPQRHALVHQDVVADLGSFADHDAHSVVDEAAPADLRAGMDFNACYGANELRENASGEREAGAVQLVTQPMQQDSMESGIAEEDFDSALRGGIATEDGIDLFPEGAEHGSYL